MRDRRWAVLCVGVCALGTVIALGAYGAHVLRSVELRSVDTRFAIRGSTGEPKDVVLVAIDEKTDNWFVAHHMQFPYPRRYHADVINRVAAGKPNAIAVDIEFIDPTNFVDDSALVSAIQRAGNVILAATEVDPYGNSNVLGGSAAVRRFGAHDADAGIPLDPDGVMRHMDESISGLTTVAVATTAVANGKPVPKAPEGVHWIDFAGPPGTVKTYSYVDVLQGKVPSSAFRGKVVVIGAPVAFLHDAELTSASSGNKMSGPEIQANAIETALHGYPLRSEPGWLTVLLIIVLGMIPLVGIRFGLGATLAVVAGAGLILALAAQGAFAADRVIVFTYPLLALVLSMFGVLVIWARSGRHGATMSDNDTS